MQRMRYMLHSNVPDGMRYVTLVPQLTHYGNIYACIIRCAVCIVCDIQPYLVYPPGVGISGPFYVIPDTVIQLRT